MCSKQNLVLLMTSGLTMYLLTDDLYCVEDKPVIRSLTNDSSGSDYSK